mmetsp:Transcript_25752/g.38880  ORF Transcript_25752/g.38880 Transcript_25752/m.38880 type:complete len:254 (-) Transcript_25752:3844-4605(-)
MVSFKLGTYDHCYVCLTSTECDSEEYILPLESLIMNLSTCSNKTLDIIRLSNERNGLIQPLQTLHSSIFLSSTTNLKIFQRNKGVYLVIYESWETVKYLQISNSSGYTIVMNGALFFPNINQDTARSPELLLTSLASNSLWTNGNQVLNNTGSLSSVNDNDTGENLPCVDLSLECNSAVGSRIINAAWRQNIEKFLKRCMIDIQEIQAQELRFQRREFLMKKSVAVLNNLFDERDQCNSCQKDGEVQSNDHNV